MDLVRHLRFFVAVAEEGHFGEAAARLEMTQPPVSQGLRRLETELGIALIRRTTRGAELTDAGRELLPRARQLIDDAGRFVSEARCLRDRADVMRWGAIPQLDTALTTAVAHRLSDTSPSQHMVTAPATVLVDQVTAGALDVAVVDIPCVIGTLSTDSAVSIPRMVVVPAGHPAATARQPRLRMLADLMFCHPPRTANSAAFDELVDSLRAAGLDPNPLPANDSGEAVASVAAGRAFCLTTRPHAYADLDGVQCISVARDITALRVRAIHRSEGAHNVATSITDTLWKCARRSDRVR